MADFFYSYATKNLLMTYAFRMQLTVLIGDLKDFINNKCFDVNANKHKYRPR